MPVVLSREFVAMRSEQQGADFAARRQAKLDRRLRLPAPPRPITPREQERRIISLKNFRRWSQQRGAENREWIADYKAKFGCHYCGERDASCLDFHHLDPATKVTEVGRMTNMPLYKITEEVSKCMVVCANCHRKSHYRERRGLAPLERAHKPASAYTTQLTLFGEVTP